MINSPYVTYLDDIQLSTGLMSGGVKAVAFFACSDMGWRLPYVSDLAEDRLFIFQSFGPSFVGAFPTILKNDVSDIIVYGHTNCRFFDFLAKPEHSPEERELISRYFQHQHQDQKEFLLLNSECNSAEALLEACRRSVLVELSNILSHPNFQDYVASGNLRFHAWVHRSDENRLEIFDPDTQEFILARATRESAAK
ncbi:MAG: carbonic anhydrase [Candidatus Melainabacteria bacterium]|nr:carbonic anhydrase [Candidatus Melainabacteria bacterium]